MSSAGFVARMLGLSMNRLSRDRHSIVAELLELLVPLVLFYGLFKADFIDGTGIIKVTLLLLMAIGIGTGSRLGIDLVSYRSQGFLREIYSSPLPTWAKLAGLLAEPFVIGVTRTLIALILLIAMGFTITPLQGAAIALIEAFAMLFSAMISMPIAARFQGSGTLNILMWLASFAQFGISGLLISAQSQPVIYLNPFSYPADLLLHVSGLAANYPFAADIAISAALLLISYFLAAKSLENLEV